MLHFEVHKICNTVYIQLILQQLNAIDIENKYYATLNFYKLIMF